jgi:hypothetical protein
MCVYVFVHVHVPTVYGVLGAGKLPSWTTTQVSESNRFTGFHSHLFLELSADVDFGHLTHFTVEGFPQRIGGSAWGREPQHILALGGIAAEDGTPPNHSDTPASLLSLSRSLSCQTGETRHTFRIVDEEGVRAICECVPGMYRGHFSLLRPHKSFMECSRHKPFVRNQAHKCV